MARELKLMTLDTETEGMDGKIKRLALYDGSEIWYGYDFDDIVPVLTDLFEFGYMPHVYIHNLDFDARKLSGLFEKGNVNWNASIMINDRMAKIVCKHYVLHDSFRILPSSLAALSKDFDVEHGKLDLWDELVKRDGYKWGDITKENKKEYLGNYFKNCDVEDELYIRYLGYDVMSLYEVIQELLKVTGLTEAEFVGRISTASLSKYCFRKGYQGEEFIHENESRTDFQIATSFKEWSTNKKASNNKTYYDLELMIRESYCGGRVEVFKNHLRATKKYPGKYYDVNSLYPYEMAVNVYPVGKPLYFEKNAAKLKWKEWRIMKQGAGFVTAKVFVPKQNIPPLPVKKGKLIFPTGYLKGTWTFTELEYAIEHCGVELEEIESLIWFQKTFPIFHNFVSRFFKLKQKATIQKQPALRQFSKLMLNVGYGYFGLKRERKDRVNLTKENQKKYHDKIKFENDELGYMEIDTFIQNDSVQPQIAAYVTSFARVHLLKFMKELEKKGNVYYCDTDSIITDVPLDDIYLDSSALGKWDLEALILEGLFLYPKVYSFKRPDGGTTKKFKGISKTTQAEFTFGDYEKLFKMMKEGVESKVLVEKNKELLRSIAYAQKKGIDSNQLEYRDKYMYFDNQQKRIYHYQSNTSEPWHMKSYKDFEEFDLNNVKPFKIYGNLFPTTD